MMISDDKFIFDNICCEIGCASGYLLNYARKYNKNIIGIEFKKMQ